MTMFFRPKPSIVHERFGDETVIVNLDSGCYYSAQGTAEIIWRLLEAGLRETDIVERMSKAYTSVNGDVSQQTGEFLRYLVSEGLIDPVEGASSETGEDDVRLEGGSFIPPALQKYSDMEELLQLDPIHEVDELGWPSTRK